MRWPKGEYTLFLCYGNLHRVFYTTGIPTFIDFQHAIAHNKIIIIDRETVITGSFNFTKSAEEKNAENLLILRSRELAREYIDNWNEHKTHSEVYKGK